MTPQELGKIAIMAIDPGRGKEVSTGTGGTGWFYVNHAAGVSVAIRDCTYGEFNELNHHLSLYHFLRRLRLRNANLHLVYEGFNIGHIYEDRPKVYLTPLEYIGVIKLFAQEFPSVQLYPQPRGMAKQFWTNDKLRKVGLNVKDRNETSAARMYLYHRTFTLNEQSLLQLLK